MNIGDKVTVNCFGVIKSGRVIRLGRPGIHSRLIWVCFDGETKERWFHSDSLSLNNG